MEFSHRPVLLDECIDALAIREDGVYVDGTAGGGGHSQEIAKRLITGRLIAIDQDPDAILAAGTRLSPYPQAKLVRSNFSRMAQVLQELGISKVDGVLLDIGVSSHQLDTPERGFSYHADAPLDMRMSQEGPSAKDLVNGLPERELSRILFEYGEERYARGIARAIVRRREEGPIETTGELVDAIKSGMPAAAKREQGHPARRTFQALRIEVNGELDRLKEGLVAAFSSLKVGGRLAVITFHSLEDRIVKRQYAAWCKGCTCPPDFPVCVCGKTPQGKLYTRKPIEAGEQELEENPRSRSAKLRVIEKIKDE